ncbi:MAG: ABC transporter substrate-binding protein [Candidatus Methylomirabilia bacterium]
MKFRIALASLLFVTLGVIADAEAAHPIVIGEINPRTGVLALMGTAVHQGILMAIEEGNARGGVAGHPLLLLSRDDEGRPERAIAAAEELVSRQGAVALVGGYVDRLVGPISEVAQRSGIPYLATASLDERLTQGDNRYFFRISSLAAFVNATTGVVLEELGAKDVAIFHSSTPGASQLTLRQRETFEAAGVRVSVVTEFSPGLSDFTPLLAHVRDQGTDVLLSNTFFRDHLLLVRQMAQADIRVKAFLGTFGMEFPRVIAQLGAESEGLFGTTSWQPGVNLGANRRESLAFIEGFTKQFGRKPVPLTMHGYAAAKTLLDALERAMASGNPLTGDLLRDALASADVQTPLGRVKFDGRGNPLFYERVVVQIQGGKHVVVYPKHRATAPVRYPAR